MNNKTKQSGFTPVNNNIFNIPSLALLPGLNIIHVQSLFGNENFLKDEIAVFFMPDSYSGPIISNILPNKNNPKQYERVDVIFDVSSIADNPFSLLTKIFHQVWVQEVEFQWIWSLPMVF